MLLKYIHKHTYVCVCVFGCTYTLTFECLCTHVYTEGERGEGGLLYI